MFQGRSENLRLTAHDKADKADLELIVWEMQMPVIPTVIIFMLCFHALLTFADCRLITSAVISFENGAMTPANVILFYLFTE